MQDSVKMEGCVVSEQRDGITWAVSSILHLNPLHQLLSPAIPDRPLQQLLQVNPFRLIVARAVTGIHGINAQMCSLRCVLNGKARLRRTVISHAPSVEDLVIGPITIAESRRIRNSAPHRSKPRSLRLHSPAVRHLHAIHPIHPIPLGPLMSARSPGQRQASE